MTSINVVEHLELLGLQVKDKVTGLKGVVTSISFDLYGCVQAIVNPGVDDKGKTQDQCWFDVARLVVTEFEPVMERPDFIGGLTTKRPRGPAEKPKVNKP